MRVSMTKARVMRALKEQPEFSHGNWCLPSDEYVWDPSRLRIKDDPNCQVCAVGAVLRHVLAPGTELSGVEDVALEATSDGDAVFGDPKAEAAAGRYLTALSCYFEQLPHDLSTATVRRRLLGFVERHFPAKIVVDINGYRSRRGLTGVKVVR